MASEAYRGLAKLELKEQGLSKLEENLKCKQMYAKSLQMQKKVIARMSKEGLNYTDEE